MATWRDVMAERRSRREAVSQVRGSHDCLGLMDVTRTSASLVRESDEESYCWQASATCEHPCSSRIALPPSDSQISPIDEPMVAVRIISSALLRSSDVTFILCIRNHEID